MDESQGLPSPSGRAPRSSEGGGIQRCQTIGQRIMDNLFLRSLTTKSRINPADSSLPSSPAKVSSVVEPDEKENKEAPLLGKVRAKCITQLLLLGAIDSIQAAN